MHSGLQSSLESSLFTQLISICYVCKRVLVTSNGFVTTAATHPANHAHIKYIVNLYLESSGQNITLRFSFVVTSAAAFGMFISTVTRYDLNKVLNPSWAKIFFTHFQNVRVLSSYIRYLIRSLGAKNISWNSVATAPTNASIAQCISPSFRLKYYLVIS